MKIPAKELTNHANLYIPVSEGVVKATRFKEYLYDFSYYGTRFIIDLNSEENKDSFIKVCKSGLSANVICNEGENWEVFTSPIDAFENC